MICIAALAVAGCTEGEDIWLNNPDDLAGITQKPDSQATPSTNYYPTYDPTYAPTATSSPPSGSYSVTTVLDKWNEWFSTETDMDSQVSNTMKMNSKLDSVLFLRTMSAPDYDKYISDTRSVALSANEWSYTLSTLYGQRNSFDDARSLLSYDVLLSSDADTYAAQMSVEMGKYEDCIKNAQTYLLSYCTYQEAYIQSGKAGQLDDTLLNRANNELKTAFAYIDEANDHWCQACYWALQLEALK